MTSLGWTQPFWIKLFATTVEFWTVSLVIVSPTIWLVTLDLVTGLALPIFWEFLLKRLDTVEDTICGPGVDEDWLLWGEAVGTGTLETEIGLLYWFFFGVCTGVLEMVIPL